MISITRAAVIAAFASALLGSAAHGQAAPKIGYINSAKILAEAPGRAEAESQYEREMGQARQQIQRMDDSLKVMVASFEKDAPSLDSARRLARAKVVQDREAQYTQRAQQLNQQMQQRQSELARPLMDQVAKALDAIRVQEGYAMVFDVGVQPLSLVSADKSLDLTDKVLARLKAAGPAKPAAAAPVQQPAGVRRPGS